MLCQKGVKKHPSARRGTGSIVSSSVVLCQCYIITTTTPLLSIISTVSLLRRPFRTTAPCVLLSGLRHCPPSFPCGTVQTMQHLRRAGHRQRHTYSSSKTSSQQHPEQWHQQHQQQQQQQQPEGAYGSSSSTRKHIAIQCAAIPPVHAIALQGVVRVWHVMPLMAIQCCSIGSSRNSSSSRGGLMGVARRAIQ